MTCTLPTKNQTNKQTMQWAQNRQAYSFLFETVENTRFPQLLKLLCIPLFWYTLFLLARDIRVDPPRSGTLPLVYTLSYLELLLHSFPLIAIETDLVKWQLIFQRIPVDVDHQRNSIMTLRLLWCDNGTKISPNSLFKRN